MRTTRRVLVLSSRSSVMLKPGPPSLPAGLAAATDPPSRQPSQLQLKRNTSIVLPPPSLASSAAGGGGGPSVPVTPGRGGGGGDMNKGTPRVREKGDGQEGPRAVDG